MSDSHSPNEKKNQNLSNLKYLLIESKFVFCSPTKQVKMVLKYFGVEKISLFWYVKLFSIEKG